MKWWHLMNTLWVSLILTSLLVLFVQDPFMTNYGIDPMAKFAYLALIGILCDWIIWRQSVWKHQLMKVSK